MSVSPTGPIAGGSDPDELGMALGKADPPAARGRAWPTPAGAASRPARRRRPSRREASMSGPATSTGLLAPPTAAPASAVERLRVGRGAPGDAPGQRVGGAVGVGLLGPVVHRDRDEGRAARRQRWRGGSRARARRERPAARGGSWLHLTYGCGPRMASRLVRLASIVIWARTCWPAVISSGDLLAWALKIPPTALPTPGAVCRLTWVGRPRGLGEAVGHAHHHELLQAEHVGEVLREVRQHRQLGRARVAEDRRHPVGTEQIEGRFANGGHGASPPRSVCAYPTASASTSAAARLPDWIAPSM